ncbi:MAG TPA: efflux RND transporter periplasmic adaptor subunit [Bacteroidota bacterium]|nr:efflux RND transporter periplasmic adaptor subunit [Bacteroidota bacterium]
MKVQLFTGTLFLFACGLSIFPAGCSGARDDQSKTGSGVAPQVVPVETAVAARAPLTVTRLYTGSLEGEEQANIVAKISERVTEIKASVGLRVRRGQYLIGLDKGGTTSQYYQADAGFRNAGKSLERMKSLYAEGAVALSVLDGTQTAYDVAKANFDAARSAVELSTPIGGVVTALNVSLGDLTAPGQVLVTVANIDRMKVVISLNENDVINVALGQEAVIYSEARPDQKVTGKIIQISKSADVRSRSFEVKALFPNSPDRWFKPGMFVKVNLNISPAGKLLAVPSGAVQTDGVTSRVFVIRGGRSYQVPVVAGVTDGERTAILQGLAEYDTVATVGANNLKDSCLVTVVNR